MATTSLEPTRVLYSLVGRSPPVQLPVHVLTDKKMDGLWEALGRSLGSISWACSLQVVGRNDHAPDGLLHSNSLHL